MKDFESSASALYDGGWRCSDREELMQEYCMTESEVEEICIELNRIEENKRLWYAAVTDDDNDCGCGSFNIDEAKELCKRYGDDYYIAVIEEGNDPVCIREIRREDF